VVEILLDHGALVDLKDYTGWTALMVASQAGHADTVKLLLEHGADKSLQDGRGSSALSVVKNAGVLRVLQNHSTTSNTSARTESGLTSGTSHDNGDKPASSKYDDASCSKEQADSIHTKPHPPPSPFRPSHTQDLTLRCLMKELKLQASEWYNIGVFLYMPTGLLDTIKRDNQNRSMDCLQEMLKAWLETTNPLPTWELVVEAVRERSAKLADKLHKKYCVP